MLDDNLKKEIEEIVESCGCALYDIAFLKENDREILRITIISKDGVTLDKCQEVTELISPLLDVKEIDLERYILEVSSPGIERNLKNPNHFICSIGELIRVRFQDKSEIEGRLVDANESSIEIDGAKDRIEYGDIKKASTIFRW